MQRVKKLILVWVLLGGALCGCGRQTSLLTTTESGQSDIAADDESGSATQKTEDMMVEASSESEGVQTDDPGQTDTTESGESARVYVYVCGAVNQSGVYELSASARKEAAVQMAGGFRADADDAYVNLAEPVTDGERIYIPTKDETADMPLTEADSADDGGSQDTSDTGKVNINTADRDELMTLPGIGESKADAIIEYREAQGKFTSPDELMKISGIKEGVYNKIKDRIIVG